MSTSGDPGFDLLVTVRHKTGHGLQSTLLVEAKANLSPASARTVLGPALATLQHLPGESAGLVVTSTGVV
jgi:hypothetical protein